MVVEQRREASAGLDWLHADKRMGGMGVLQSAWCVEDGGCQAEHEVNEEWCEQMSLRCAAALSACGIATVTPAADEMR